MVKWIVTQNDRYVNVDCCSEIYKESLGNTTRIYARIAGTSASTVELGAYRQDHAEEEFARLLVALSVETGGPVNSFTMASEKYYFESEDEKKGESK